MRGLDVKNIKKYDNKQLRLTAIMNGFQSEFNNIIAVMKMSVVNALSGAAAKRGYMPLEKKIEKLYFLSKMKGHYLTNTEGAKDAHFEACDVLMDYYKKYPYVSREESMAADEKIDLLHEVFAEPRAGLAEQILKAEKNKLVEVN